MVETILQSVRYLYKVRYIPRRCQKFRAATLVAQDVVSLCRASPSEARPVFRINHHARDSFQPVINREILLFDDQLWWPVVRNEEHFTADEFLAGCEAGRTASLQYLLNWPVFHDARPEQLDLSLIARKIGHSTQDEVLARLRRQASETLLCGGRVFRKGGEPIYVRPVLHQVGVYGATHYESVGGVDRPPILHDLPYAYGEVLVADLASRHSLAPFFRGECASEQIRESICYGAVFRADELHQATALEGSLPGIQSAKATIEVLEEAALRADPIGLQVEQFVRDLYRNISQLGPEHISKTTSLTTVVAMFRKLVQSKIARDDGVAAIEAYRNWCRCERNSAEGLIDYILKLSERAIEHINSHCARRGIEPLFKLTDEEEAALASLALQ